MNAAQIFKDTEERMDKAVEKFRNDLKGLRTGRASPALLDSLRVEYYGSPTPVKQLAQVTTPEPQQILIRPFDAGALKEIEKAIRGSDLGLAPNNDGKVIRLQIPSMSGDQRKKMAAVIKKLAEEAKVACRNVRRDANKHLEAAEKAKTLTEDELDQGKEKVQTLLKTIEDKVQDLGDKKTAEVMEQ